MRASVRRSGCCASSIHRAPRAGISRCPIPTTAPPGASRRSSTSCRPPARGCWRRSEAARWRERPVTDAGGRAGLRGDAGGRSGVSLPEGARVLARVGGGDINEAYRVVLPDGRQAFVKTRSDASPGEYETEAAGLRWLGEAGSLRVPEVLEVGEDYLVME